MTYVFLLQGRVVKDVPDSEHLHKDCPITHGVASEDYYRSQLRVKNFINSNAHSATLAYVTVYDNDVWVKGWKNKKYPTYVEEY